MSFSPRDILYSTTEQDTMDTVVHVKGVRAPVRVPISVQRSMRDDREFFSFIAAEIARRVRERLFPPNRHDHFKGFRA